MIIKASRSVRIISFVKVSIIASCICLIFSSFSACSPKKAATDATELTREELAAAQKSAANGGNLHYQNLVLAVDERILFNSAAGQLTIAASDGQNNQALSKISGSNLSSDGNMLYYTSGLQTGVLEKINLDGTNQVRIGTTPLKYLIFNDNFLYAIEADDGDVIQLKTDGTGRKLLLDTKAIALNLTDEILYVTGADDSSGLSAVNLQTGTTEQLLQQQVGSLNIYDHWLYYVNPADNYKVYAFSPNSKKSWQISQFSIEKPFVISEGFLYYIVSTDQNRLYRLPVDGRKSLAQKPELIIDDAVGSFAVCLQDIYYQRPNSNRIYKVSCSGGTPRQIT